MESMQEYHLCVGEILMYCQMIEHDIKRIYAFMADGGYEENLLMLQREKCTLGQTVTKMREFDQAWEKPLFKPEDYDLLFQIVNKRNHYAHQGYLDFVYVIGEEQIDRAYNLALERAKQDKEKLSLLYEAVEDVKLSYVDL